MADDRHLRAALGIYPHTRALKTGALSNADVSFDFVEVEPIHKAFAPMVRRAAYDLSELAIVTALQALDHGRPVVLLPVVVAARMQRGCLIALSSKGTIDPRDLVGKRIGVRAYTQTTGMWVRAALREDHGLDVTDFRWVTHDPAHVEEYRDPSFVIHENAGKSLVDQLRDGDIDAAILGNDLPKDDAFAPVIRDHRAIDRAWVARHGFMPINHVVAVSEEAFATKPRAVRAAYELLGRSAAEARRPAGSPDVTLFGADTLRAPLRFLLEECRRQQLIKRSLDIDEILAPAAALLEGVAIP
jgi:4,5-dihydroxyphthalate decarboxylase